MSLDPNMVTNIMNPKNGTKKNVFLTGISGFVAGHIALLLPKSGVKLTGSVRS